MPEECSTCGRSNDTHECPDCGEVVCHSHRLPSTHDCDGVVSHAPNNDVQDSPDGLADGWVDTEEDKRTENPYDLSSDSDSFSLDEEDLQPSRTDRVLGMFGGLLTYVLLGAMVAVYALQYLVLPALGVNAPSQANLTGDPLWRSLFILTPEHPEYVWTWVTSVFSHGGLFHLLGNAIIIFFFGRMLEREVGTRDFALLFFGSGILAGLGQIGASALAGSSAGVLGASGAALAIMAALTFKHPNLEVMLLIPPIPIKLWILTAFYGGMTLFGFLGGGVGAGGVAQIAHAVGLLIGLGYAYYETGGNITMPKLPFSGGNGGI